jgi:hypothetical protein
MSEISRGSGRYDFFEKIVHGRQLDPISKVAIESLKEKYSDRELLLLSQRVKILETDSISVVLEKLQEGASVDEVVGVIIQRLPKEILAEIGITPQDSLFTRCHKLKTYDGHIEHLDLSNLAIREIPIEIKALKAKSIDCTGTPLSKDEKQSLIGAALADKKFIIKGITKEDLLPYLESALDKPIQIALPMMHRIINLANFNHILDPEIMGKIFNRLENNEMLWLLSGLEQRGDELSKIIAMIPTERFVQFALMGTLNDLYNEIGPAKCFEMLLGIFDKCKFEVHNQIISTLSPEKHPAMIATLSPGRQMAPPYSYTHVDDLNEIFAEKAMQGSLFHFEGQERSYIKPIWKEARSLDPSVQERWLSQPSSNFKAFYQKIGAERFNQFIKGMMVNPANEALISRVFADFSETELKKISDFQIQNRPIYLDIKNKIESFPFLERMPMLWLFEVLGVNFKDIRGLSLNNIKLLYKFLRDIPKKQHFHLGLIDVSELSRLSVLSETLAENFLKEARGFSHDLDADSIIHLLNGLNALDTAGFGALIEKMKIVNRLNLLSEDKSKLIDFLLLPASITIDDIAFNKIEGLDSSNVIKILDLLVLIKKENINAFIDSSVIDGDFDFNRAYEYIFMQESVSDFLGPQLNQIIGDSKADREKKLHILKCLFAFNLANDQELFLLCKPFFLDFDNHYINYFVQAIIANYPKDKLYNALPVILALKQGRSPSHIISLSETILDAPKIRWSPALLEKLKVLDRVVLTTIFKYLILTDDRFIIPEQYLGQFLDRAITDNTIPADQIIRNMVLEIPNLTDALLSYYHPVLGSTDINIVKASSSLLSQVFLEPTPIIDMDSPLAQEIVGKYILSHPEIQDDPQNPYLVFERVKKSYHETIEVEVSTQDVYGERVVLNLEKIGKLTIDILASRKKLFTYGDIEKKCGGSLPSLKELEAIFNRLIARVGEDIDVANARLGSSESEEFSLRLQDPKLMSLRNNLCNNPYIPFWFSKQKEDEIVSPHVTQLISIAHYIKSLPDEIETGHYFSKKEEMLLLLSDTLRHCETGQLEQLDRIYRLIPDEAKFSQKLAGSSLIPPTESTLLDMEQLFLKKAFSKKGNVHDAYFLQNLIGPRLGLLHEPVFDPHTHAISESLVKTSNANILKAQLMEIDLKGLVVIVAEMIDSELSGLDPKPPGMSDEEYAIKNKKAEDLYNKKLKHLLEGQEDILEKYFPGLNTLVIFMQDRNPEEKWITPEGALFLLKAAHLLKEVKEDEVKVISPALAIEDTPPMAGAGTGAGGE